LKLADFTIKAHDTYPPLEGVLRDAVGPVDLTGADVKLNLKTPGGGGITVTGDCSIVGDPTAGHVRYSWDPADTASVNTFDGEFEVTWADSTITTFPSATYFSVEIKADLG
jgi:hypothetical protein